MWDVIFLEDDGREKSFLVSSQDFSFENKIKWSLDFIVFDTEANEDIEACTFMGNHKTEEDFLSDFNRYLNTICDAFPEYDIKVLGQK